MGVSPPRISPSLNLRPVFIFFAVVKLTPEDNLLPCPGIPVKVIFLIIALNIAQGSFVSRAYIF